MSEERYPYLNEEEYIILDVAEEGDDKKKIHALRWEVYVKYNEEFMKRNVLVSVNHPKREKRFWSCVKDHIIDEKEQYESIGLRGFDYKLFEEEKGGGTRERLYGYRY